MDATRYPQLTRVLADALTQDEAEKKITDLRDKLKQMDRLTQEMIQTMRARRNLLADRIKMAEQHIKKKWPVRPQD